MRLLTAEELARLGKALDGEESFAPSAVTAFRLLLYTGARLSETQTLKWENIRGNRIHLPDSKTGAKTIPLNGPALEVLADAKRVDGNPYVVVGTKDGAYLTDLQKPRRRVRKGAELEDVRIHDLRHRFASEGGDGRGKSSHGGTNIGPYSSTDHSALCASRLRSSTKDLGTSSVLTEKGHKPLGAGRRHRNLVDSVKRANICPVPTRTSDASDAATPYLGETCPGSDDNSARARAGQMLKALLRRLRPSISH